MAPPGLAVIVYLVIGLPPFDTGALKLTVARALPAVALTLVGAPGDVPGVRLDVEVDAGPVPTPLTALTVKTYDVPLVSPVIVTGLAGPVAVRLPGLEVTM